MLRGSLADSVGDLEVLATMIAAPAGWTKPVEQATRKRMFLPLDLRVSRPPSLDEFPDGQDDERIDLDSGKSAEAHTVLASRRTHCHEMEKSRKALLETRPD